jgi:membrane-bound metal-dependent hydrolase YbcI (DUF457 family)
VPSPIGHGLAGLAAGWAIASPATEPRARLVQTASFLALGAAPDLDLLFNHHRYETHSIGAALLAGAVAAAIGWPLASTRLRTFFAATAAWATHPLLDMLAPDHWPPIGVMAFWPFSRGFYITGIEIFLPIGRDWRSAAVWWLDARAAARELAILLPIVALVWWVRTRTSRSRDRSSGRAGRHSPSA